jgi:hypothetical protein
LYSQPFIEELGGPGLSYQPCRRPLWLNNKVTDGKDPIYRQLSVTLQFLLKRYVRDYHFRDIAKYQDLTTAYLVLLYAAIPPSNAILVDGLQASVDDGTYWDAQDINAVKAMALQARDSVLPQGFKAQLAQAQARLKDAGQDNLSKFYDPSDGVNGIFNTAVGGANMELLKDSLLFDEANVLSGAHAAGLAAANFNSLKAQNQPVQALKALADFGNEMANAFNKDLGNQFVDQDSLRRLSALIIAQAANVFDPSVQTSNFDSTLNVTVLNPGVAMPSDFPDFTVQPGDALVSLNAASFSI